MLAISWYSRKQGGIPSRCCLWAGESVSSEIKIYPPRCNPSCLHLGTLWGRSPVHAFFWRIDSASAVWIQRRCQAGIRQTCHSEELSRGDHRRRTGALQVWERVRTVRQWFSSSEQHRRYGYAIKWSIWLMDWRTVTLWTLPTHALQGGNLLPCSLRRWLGQQNSPHNAGCLHPSRCPGRQLWMECVQPWWILSLLDVVTEILILPHD